MHVFKEFAINKDRHYLRTQLKWMKTNARAVELTKAGTAMIVQLTDAGAAHVTREALIDGIKKPSFGSL